MLLFYCFILILLLTALSFIVIPFIRNKAIFSKSFLIISSFMTIFSLGIYFFLGSELDLKNWLTKGQKHYALLEQVDNLGGIDGMINRIQAKLDNNPNDAQGWSILGKLYLAKNDQENAEKAFKKAKSLKN